MINSKYYTLLLTGALLTTTAGGYASAAPLSDVAAQGGGTITTQDTSDTTVDYYTLTKDSGAFRAAQFNSSGDSYVGLDVQQDGRMIVSIEKYNFKTRKWDPVQVKLIEGSKSVYYRVPTDVIHIPPVPYRVMLSTTGKADVTIETTYTWESDSDPR
ncbi:hypothetical protein [Paenibacillus shenyangensis]|uniref:hypothetical protein n=1 Tax=Paenibacillus sp. A9 TaxID=1284352 RepID=UPI000372A24F|nr:hypothetical protein [Paenibacillus sp. A9]